MTRKTLIAIPALLLASIGLAQAQSFPDRARVLSVEPRYETVQVPRQSCESRWVQDAPYAAGPQANGYNYGGVAIGGIAGGLLGHQIGRGNGRDAATAVGAVVGALAGDHLAGGGYAQPQYVSPPPREERFCRTAYDQQSQLSGYTVVYEYRGTRGTTVTREQPGQTIPVRVSVEPVAEGYGR